MTSVVNTSWQVDTTSTPLASSATQIRFSTQNDAYDQNLTLELRVNGTSLAFDAVTGVISGTITTLEL